MERVRFAGVTTMGCVVYGASVLVPEDYSMNQLVTAIRNNGYQMFMTESMKVFAKV